MTKKQLYQRAIYIGAITLIYICLIDLKAYSLSPQSYAYRVEEVEKSHGVVALSLEEAISRYRQIELYQQKFLQSPLCKEVTLNLYLSSTENGWYNFQTNNSGFYGKILPPMALSDGSTIVPLIGDVFAFKSFDLSEDPNQKGTLRLKKLSKKEIESHLGLRPLLIDSKHQSVKAYTHLDMTTRHAFLNGPFGYVDALATTSGKVRTIDSSQDLIEALLAGETLRFTQSRFELKGLGATQLSFHGFVDRAKNRKYYPYKGTVSSKYTDIENYTVHFREERKFSGFNLWVHDEEGEQEVSLEEFARWEGTLLDSLYQPGFPSPTGLMVNQFADDELAVESHFRNLGGKTSNHVVSHFKVTGDHKAVLRLTPQKTSEGEHSLRIFEAFKEYEISPENALLSRWQSTGEIENRLWTFFNTMGGNQRALLLSGKLWIILGAELIHDTVQSEKLNLDETYTFFLKNMDIIEGRVADLGDYLDFSKSLNDEDLKESLSIMVWLLGHFITDLAQRGIIEDTPILRSSLFKAFAEGFLRSEYNGVVPTDKFRPLEYTLKKKVKTTKFDAYKDHPKNYYWTHEREMVSVDFEAFVNNLHEDIHWMLEYWPILPDAYNQWSDMTVFKRFGPLNKISSEKLSNIAEKIDKLGTKVDNYFSQKLLAVKEKFKHMDKDNIVDIMGLAPYGRDNDEPFPRMNSEVAIFAFLREAKVQLDKNNKLSLSNVLIKLKGRDGLSIQEKKTLELLIQLDRALKKGESDILLLPNRKLPIEEALQEINDQVEQLRLKAGPIFFADIKVSA